MTRGARDAELPTPGAPVGRGPALSCRRGGRPRRATLALGALALSTLAGCPAADPAPPCASTGTCPPASTCPDGFVPDAADAGCEGLLPPGDCGPGTTPRLGKATCEPLGWTTCPEGFIADGSGWGCAPVVAEVCAPDLRPALGSAGCLPVGDCSGSFPPPEATLFVDAAGPTDATHFRTLGAAVAVAPPGAVVALEAGTYAESVTLRLPITLVGRCAAQVRLVGPFDQMAGLLVSGAQGVVIRGLTVADHALSGIYVYKGGSAEVQDVVAEGNTGNGLYVAGAGSALRVRRTLVQGSKPDGAGRFGWGAAAQSQGTLQLTDTALVANTRYGLAVTSGAAATFQGVVVRSTLPGANGLLGYGLAVEGGATATVTRSLVERNAGLGVRVADPSSTVALTESVVRLTVPDGVPFSGHGVVAMAGGKVTLRSTVVAENARAGVMVKGAGSSARVEASVVRGPLPWRPGAFAYGVVADEQGTLELLGSALVGNVSNGVVVQQGARAHLAGVLVRGTVTAPLDLASRLSGSGVGLTVGQGSLVEVEGSAFVGNHSVGLVATVLGEPGQTPDPVAVAPTVTLKGSLIVGTRAGANGNGGHGLDSAGGAQVTVEGSVLADNQEAGVLVVQKGSGVSLTSTLVSGTRARADGAMGHGVVAGLGSTATVKGSWLRQSAGVGFAASASTGRLVGTAVLDNVVGLHVQSGSTLVNARDTGTLPAPLEVVVTTDCVFAGNVARVGTEQVPLPEPVGR